MTEIIELIHERVDDIPLLIGLSQRLHLPEIIDKDIGNHGHHQGLSNGQLTTVWLSYILSEGDHTFGQAQCPDLPQLKLMGAAAEPSGHIM